MATTTCYNHGTYSIDVQGDFEFHSCGTCGITWAMPVGFILNRRRDHAWFYCPNGHEWHYSGESDIERERRLKEEARDRAARERALRDQAEASLRATKGVVTKQRKQLNRVAKGVCPCCNRSFADLRKHMQTKHPEFVPEKAAKS